MAGKATPKKQDNRANPIAKKGKGAKPARGKEPKDSHLYTDDNPETTLQGTGFKDAATASNTSKYSPEVNSTPHRHDSGRGDWVVQRAGNRPVEHSLRGGDTPGTQYLHPIFDGAFGFKDAATASNTISLVSKRSLLYQWQTINTMYNRAKHHPKKTKDMEAAMAVFEKWLKETYPKQKAEMRVFKPLQKKTVEMFLPKLKEANGIDTKFAELYVTLEPRKKLANVLVDDTKPGEFDWDRTRVEALSQLVPDESNEVEEGKLWEKDGVPSNYHLSLIAWAWSPLTEYKLLKGINKG